MSQRNPGIGRATTGCRNTRHHLERNAVGRQLFDLFATTTKDERVPPLEAQHALALLGQVYQLLVDLVLGHRVIGATLADVHALGITTAQFQNRRRNQTVVQHHVGLLHQAQCTEGQQIRVAWARAHQVHLAGRVRRRAIDLFDQQALSLIALPGQLAVGNRALEHFFPERPALLHIRVQTFDLSPKTRGQPSQLTVG